MLSFAERPAEGAAGAAAPFVPLDARGVPLEMAEGIVRNLRIGSGGAENVSKQLQSI